RATQQYLLNTLQQHTDSTGYALAAAMTLGQKAHLTGTTKQYFSASGTSHLLAVSGLHVGILFMAISFLFAPLGNNHHFKVFQQLLIIVLLWLYAFLCGLPPSIVRAVTMFSVGALGIISQQKSQGLNNLFFTAFVMLLYNPNYLFDMGFQLSFSAVIGILLYVESRRSKVASQCKVSAEASPLGYAEPKPDFMSKANNGQCRVSAASKKTNRLLIWIKDMCGASIAAQMGTFPLILYYFGTFPTYFLLSNLLLIPLVLYWYMVVYCYLFFRHFRFRIG
ncbi:MAG: ComEC/Rec2 family competence protein, partial [Paludibacteraceae bacterium]|nr:ComEC/Rec2 family competence protein [Paludibacteraceae bacterium]